MEEAMNVGEHDHKVCTSSDSKNQMRMKDIPQGLVDQLLRCTEHTIPT